MNPSHREGWPPSSGPPGYGNVPRAGEQPPSRGPTQQGSYGSSPGGHQQPSQSGGPVLPPPPGPFHPAASGPSGPSFPSMPGMAQPSPSHQTRPPPSHEQQQSMPTQQQHSVPQPGSYPLPSINQAPPHSLPPQQAYDREREIQEARDREAREREYEQQGRREREAREREMRDRQQREQHTPHQNHAEPIQLHQPVAVGPQMRTAIHGPNGLLSSSGPSANQPQAPAPAGNSNSMFNQQYEGTPRMAAQPPPQGPAQNVMGYGGTPTMSQAPQAIPPAQQPILNDALSYLDQVKVQFSGEPNVYNQFLDIMKDFKSQAIDTPGVIRRVSSLFAGNPNLIQGFNTFLPPGYRIECGSDGDPNAIRVTTPMGTTVSPMGSTLRPLSRPRSVVNDPHGQGSFGQPVYDSGRPEGGRSHQAGLESFDGMPSPNLRAQHGYQPQSAENQARHSPFESAPQREGMGVNAALLAHQQEQRGVQHLSSAVSAAAGDPHSGQNASPQPSSTPMTGAVNGGGPHQAGPLATEKRGPVEFNHAISYVNKIKNRFASQPEIYKQFLEILQTYQRESKPIQDVYAQVTHLFNGAPDLLEDFKQFLPESAAHAKAAAARQAAEDMTMLSSARGGDAGYSNQTAQARHTPRPEQPRLPPVGNFAPTPSANRDSKRKRDRQQGSAMPPAAAPDFSAGMAATKNGFATAKRPKQGQQLQQVKPPGQLEGPPVSPSLVPALPEPMPPSSSSGATPEELQFFDKVRKFIGNKTVMTEFLKICNLYSQDLIDKNQLVTRISTFIGHNAELFNWFKAFVNFDDKDQMIENRAKSSSGRITLNNCRAYGPSYRMLPRRERLKPCSGRDELCNSVLNDEWASHPTWASEDSGFIAHRKNVHEEGLHRVEEERYDYDLNIAMAERTIQLLEPLAQQLRMMSEEDKARWTLPSDFGGQALPIYRKTIARIYGREDGIKIMNHMFELPAQTVPVILSRCRQKAEEWKATQREWERVWREQTQKMFWKSLDHQGQGAKLADKRQFQTKTLQNEIQVRYEEQKRQRLNSNSTIPKYQNIFRFGDVDVLMDASYLLLTFAEHSHASDFPRLTTFIHDFVPLFFGRDTETFQQRIRDVFTNVSADDDMEVDTPASDDSALPRGRRANGKNLLRDVLDKGGRPVRSGRNEKEESVASGSRASTPEVGATVADEEGFSIAEPREDDGKPKTWLEHPVDGNISKKQDVKPNEPFKRQTFNLYANLPIYCFFRMFFTLYERLHNLKLAERDVHDVVRRAKAPKAAIELKMTDKHPDAFFQDTSKDANYYVQMLNILEEFLKGESSMDMSHIEEILRRFYLQSGWLLYSFDKMLSALVRFAIAIIGNDGSKEKSYEILQLFQKDRRKEMTTHQDELTYRRQVEKYIKDGDVYRISFNPSTMTATTRILKPNETTFDATTSPTTAAALAAAAEEDGMYTAEQRWAYYVSSYSSIEPTEGIPVDDCSPTFLKRNLRKAIKRNAARLQAGASATGENDTPADAEDKEADELERSRLDTIRSREALKLRISPDNYKIYWSETGSEEWWLAAGVGGGKRASSKATKDASGQDTAMAGADDQAKTGDKEEKESKTEGDATHEGGEDGEHHADMEDPANAFEEKFVMNNRWMAGLSRDEVEKRKTVFRDWKAGTGTATLTT